MSEFTILNTIIEKGLILIISKWSRRLRFFFVRSSLFSPNKRALWVVQSGSLKERCRRALCKWSIRSGFTVTPSPHKPPSSPFMTTSAGSKVISLRTIKKHKKVSISFFRLFVSLWGDILLYFQTFNVYSQYKSSLWHKPGVVGETKQNNLSNEKEEKFRILSWQIAFVSSIKSRKVWLENFDGFFFLRRVVFHWNWHKHYNGK